MGWDHFFSSLEILTGSLVISQVHLNLPSSPENTPVLLKLVMCSYSVIMVSELDQQTEMLDKL